MLDYQQVKEGTQEGTLRGLRGLSAKKIHFVLDVTRENIIVYRSHQTKQGDNMTIIILTYENGYQVARFRDDKELLETLLTDYQHISDIQEIAYEGRVFSPERAVRELIRQQGKEMARKTFETMIGEQTFSNRLYFPKKEQ